MRRVPSATPSRVVSAAAAQPASKSKGSWARPTKRQRRWQYRLRSLVLSGSMRRQRNETPKARTRNYVYSAASDQPGEYVGYCRSTSVYLDKQFRRWVCAVQFDVFDELGISILARLTWYLSLGSKRKPAASRRGNYWPAWIRANGAPPKRTDRMSPKVFEQRYAVVVVADTTKTHKAGSIDPDLSYSVIREVIEWKPREVPHAIIEVPSDQVNHSNHPSRKATSKPLKKKEVTLQSCQSNGLLRRTSSGPSRGQGNSNHSFPRGGRRGNLSSVKGKVAAERASAARRYL